MNLPMITEVGRLTGDPTLAYTQTGTAYAKFTVAFNGQAMNPQTGIMEQNGKAFFARSTAWGHLAEEAASLTKGTEVFVQGSIRSTEWTDQQTGQTRYGTELTIRNIGRTLPRYSTPNEPAASPSGNVTTPTQPPAEGSDEPPF